MNRYLLLVLIIFIYIAGCQSSGDLNKEDLSAAKIFQKAYEASDSQNYSLALQYYSIYQERFPDDRDGNIWALYEIAFLYHKMGNEEKATQLFEELIDKYQGNETEEFPQAPLVLAQKVITNINEENN